MLSQLHMAKSGTYAFQVKMQVIADNIANAQTVGHKKQDMHTESLFPHALSDALSEIKNPEITIGQKKRRYQEFGSAVRLADIDKDFSQGTLEQTNRPLDLAIKGKGFFQYRMPEGQLVYSRAGNLFLDSGRNLVGPDGHPIEPPITIPQDATQVVINDSGQVFVQLRNQADVQELGQVLVATFPREKFLRSVGQNFFKASDDSGLPQISVPGENGSGQVKQKSLEYSNVNLIEEMMNMLLTERSFQIVVGSINSIGDLIKASMDVPK